LALVVLLIGVLWGLWVLLEEVSAVLWALVLCSVK